MCPKVAGRMANCTDLDQTAPSDQSLPLSVPVFWLRPSIKKFIVCCSPTLYILVGQVGRKFFFPLHCWITRKSQFSDDNGAKKKNFYFPEDLVPKKVLGRVV